MKKCDSLALFTTIQITDFDGNDWTNASTRKHGIRRKWRTYSTRYSFNNNFRYYYYSIHENHLYKIWNHDRTKKKFAFAASISELFQIASESLNIKTPHKVVLEEDGTEISSDEVLRACSESVLLILEPGKEWVPSFIFRTNHMSAPDLYRNSSIKFVNGLYNVASSINNDGHSLGDGHNNEGYESISDDVKVGQ
ncbi:hypothetical protein Btru_042526 [Bulinus truncatus]|nr:hypothetical protein Btru_042526 [Bulinus truncatus]